MRHTVGYFEDVDQGAVAANIAAMADPTITVNGDDVRVPADRSMLAGGSMVSAATTQTAVQIRTPSLLDRAYYSVSPWNITATPANPPAGIFMPNNPIQLASQENMNFNTNTDHAAAIEIYGMVHLQDAPQAPVVGEIFTVRATAAITLVQGVWTQGNLTFTQELPAGNYDVVGLRVQSANLVMARLIMIGNTWRPGVLGANVNSDLDQPGMRRGEGGVIGSFDNNTLPSIEAVGVTDTAQQVWLDLIKTG